MAAVATDLASLVDSRTRSTAFLNESPEVISRVQTAVSTMHDAPRRMSSSSLPPFHSLLMPPAAHTSSMTHDRDLAIADRGDQSASQVSERVAAAAGGRGIPSSEARASQDEIYRTGNTYFERDYNAPSSLRTRPVYPQPYTDVRNLQSWPEGYETGGGGGRRSLGNVSLEDEGEVYVS